MSQPKPLPAAVVFDLDGTLIDSAPDITVAVNRFLDRHGRPSVSADQVRTMIGDGVLNLIRYAFAATGFPLAPDHEADRLAEFMEIYDAQPTDARAVYPGVVETLDRLAASGVRLGLCTNKPEQATRTVLAQTGLAGRFAALAGGDTLPVRKPDGRHLAWVIEKLGATPGSAVMVGDNGNDMAVARAVGVPAIAVSYGYPRMPIADLGADIVIDHFAHLPDALARLPATRPDTNP